MSGAPGKMYPEVKSMIRSKHGPWGQGRLQIEHTVGHDPDLSLTQSWQTDLWWHVYADEHPDGEERRTRMGYILWSLVEMRLGASRVLSDLDSIGAEELSLGDALTHIEITGRLTELCDVAVLISHVDLAQPARSIGLEYLAVRDITRIVTFGRDEPMVLINPTHQTGLPRDWSTLEFDPVLTDHEIWIGDAAKILRTPKASICEPWLAEAWLGD